MGTTSNPNRAIIVLLALLAIPAVAGILAPVGLNVLPSAAGESAAQLAETGAQGLLPIIIIGAILVIAGVALTLLRARKNKSED
ncbi:LPXTG-motif cell wall-anchored protein [Mycetocola sp. BIGb0189]|uniref:LPXTG cell wall anchor domain-containing protein n=1 Tax=Mycetocola sp. BIGb0189 TaxID=2940604 RepID=UPI0021677981|nr:LPXTG cell wall anchor domain-containing protein [Mycetocola sp. BIGb0189]MCS4277340.1 LPXTG-motif cell wall-anchored protein [Mycetocola sp. BIGb0189]